MPEVVLVEPQIATNTGNIIRLCANVGARLHLVRPLGFDVDDAALRVAVDSTITRSPTRASGTRGKRAGPRSEGSRVGSPRRRACPRRRYDEIEYRDDDVVVFGCEATGLGDALLAEFPSEHRLHIPMRARNRSLNLANAVSVVLYEAWRQRDFADAATGTFEESLRPPTARLDESLRSAASAVTAGRPRAPRRRDS